MTKAKEPTEQQQRIAAIVGADPKGFPLKKDKKTLALYRNYLIERLQLLCLVVDEEENEDDEDFDDKFEEDEEFAGTAESPYRFVALAKPLQRRIADKLDSISGINGIFESDTDTMTAPLLFVSVAEDSPNYRLIEDYKSWS